MRITNEMYKYDIYIFIIVLNTINLLYCISDNTIQNCSWLKIKCNIGKGKKSNAVFFLSIKLVFMLINITSNFFISQSLNKIYANFLVLLHILLDRNKISISFYNKTI